MDVSGTVRFSKDLQINPVMAPISDTFRFHEPSESHFVVALPQFIQTNQPGLNVSISNPDCKAEVLEKSNIITVSGKTGDVLTMQSMTLFIFADILRHNLLATVKVEVHAREVIYTRIKFGQTSSHTLSIPASTARTVHLYSNKSRVVQQSQQEKNRDKRLLVGTTTHFNVLLTVNDKSQL